MRIVNREQFLALPAGTLYQKYEPCYTQGAIEIKQESLYNDWYALSLDGVISLGSNNSGELYESLERMEMRGASYPIDLNTVSRDGLYNEDQLFLIWGRSDVEQLSAKLIAILAADAGQK